MSGQQQGYGLVGGLAGEWRQQPWPAHHHHHHPYHPPPHPAHQPPSTPSPVTTTPTPAHYQWSGLQGGYGGGQCAVGGFYQGYQESGIPQDLTPMPPYNHHNLAYTPPSQVYTHSRTPDTLHGLGSEGALYSGRLTQTSPDHASGGGGSPQSGGSPNLSQAVTVTTTTTAAASAAAAATTATTGSHHHHHHHADMFNFILPDLSSPPGPPAAVIKGEGLGDPLTAYTTPSPHPWSPLSPPAACM